MKRQAAYLSGVAASAAFLGMLFLDTVPANAQTVLTNSNGIIRNSLCVGFDCQSGISFSDSTLVLKENNTRIKFADTSATASFPRNDWEIEANSSSNGGANYLGFNDCGQSSNNGGCASDLVFAVEAGARQNALYVESDGDVGFGTSNPVVDLHMVSGNTPTVRLEQNGSSGFAPQTWDVAGNETNFFIRDVTNGSRLPLRIRPNAPTSSIDVAGSGDVGIGTASPADDLHLRRASGSVAIRLDSGGATYPVRLNLNANQDEFRITFDGTPATQFRLDENGNVVILGTITTSGSCATPCDGVFSADYELPSIEKQASMMWKAGHLPSIGATPEAGQYDLTRMTLGMLTELEKAHIYIEQLNNEKTAIRSQLDRMAETKRVLEDKVSSLEGRLSSLEDRSVR